MAHQLSSVSVFFSLSTQVNSSFTSVSPPSWTSPLAFLSLLVTPWSPEEKAGIERTTWYKTKGMGYFAQQNTQPQTLGYSLADSPVGLLAWIYEKLVLWTDNYKWSDDEGSNSVTFSAYCLSAFETVLTWISLFWFSRAGPAASIRIYFEMGSDCFDLGPCPTIPMGASFFPKDLVVLPAACVSSNQLSRYETNLRL